MVMISDSSIITSGILLFVLVCFTGAAVIKSAAKERRFLVWSLGVGLTLLAAFAVVSLFDVFAIAGQRWMFWKYASTSWSRTAIFAAATAATLSAATLALLVTPQDREGLVLRRVGAFLGALVLAGGLLFWFMDIPIPLLVVRGP
jgi:hypothetical protein